MCILLLGNAFHKLLIGALDTSFKWVGQWICGCFSTGYQLLQQCPHMGIELYNIMTNRIDASIQGTQLHPNHAGGCISVDVTFPNDHFQWWHTRRLLSDDESVGMHVNLCLCQCQVRSLSSTHAMCGHLETSEFGCWCGVNSHCATLLNGISASNGIFIGINGCLWCSGAIRKFLAPLLSTFGHSVRVGQQHHNRMECPLAQQWQQQMTSFQMFGQCPQRLQHSNCEDFLNASAPSCCPPPDGAGHLSGKQTHDLFEARILAHWVIPQCMDDWNAQMNGSWSGTRCTARIWWSVP